MNLTARLLKLRKNSENALPFYKKMLNSPIFISLVVTLFLIFVPLMMFSKEWTNAEVLRERICSNEFIYVIIFGIGLELPIVLDFMLELITGNINNGKLAAPITVALAVFIPIILTAILVILEGFTFLFPCILFSARLFFIYSFLHNVNQLNNNIWSYKMCISLAILYSLNVVFQTFGTYLYLSNITTGSTLLVISSVFKILFIVCFLYCTVIWFRYTIKFPELTNKHAIINEYLVNVHVISVLIGALAVVIVTFVFEISPDFVIWNADGNYLTCKMFIYISLTSIVSVLHSRALRISIITTQVIYIYIFIYIFICI